MNKNIKEAFMVLYSKKKEMQIFFSHYIFEKMKIDPYMFIDDQTKFLFFIDFCLNARQRKVRKQHEQGLKYFKRNYKKIRDYIISQDIINLQNIVYESPGVGQKIGSLIIELIYLYSKYADETVLCEAYLPIDVHTKRILENSFKIEVPNIGIKVKSEKFITFQKELNQYTDKGLSRVYLDYLWFVGKVFCTKITDSNNKGYKLCNLCWIKPFCCNNKWE